MMGFPRFSDHFVNAVHDKERAKTLEQQTIATSLASGQLTEGQVSGVIAIALAKLMKSGTTSEELKNKERMADFVFQALLQQIEQLNQEIALLEAAFEAEHGDAWREKLALKILNEDDIPQQQSGETIEQYRERLEKLLVGEMLNADGSIKQKYKDDIELRKYAEWAQKVQLREAGKQLANEMKQGDINSPQVQNVLEELIAKANSELNISTAQELAGHEEQKQVVMSLDKKVYDEDGSVDYSEHAKSFDTPIVKA